MQIKLNSLVTTVLGQWKLHVDKFVDLDVSLSDRAGSEKAVRTIVNAGSLVGICDYVTRICRWN